ncbi:hypothetical protein H8S90_02050 [Olivibacter sp. SDN3]|uniref:hypothetical protein n=1 Tax=Olivibacter sp. SDN3 TaxID=2764720 RepID=UPI0016512ACA|nr:hypothetical protein [Olivibacter sp. SDN3]QNL50429.1 hypothetical protein H8S90_02050 [Olivibacter sp. SDN3]
MQDKLFDREIKNIVHNYEPRAPVDLWGKIERELDVNHPKVVAINRGRARVSWLKIAAAIVALLGAVSWFTRQKNEVIYLQADKSKTTLANERPNSFARMAIKSSINSNKEVSVLPRDAEHSTLSEHFPSRDIKETLYVEHGTVERRGGRIEQEVSRPMLAVSEDRIPSLLAVNSLPLVNVNNVAIEEPAKPLEKEKRTLAVSDLLNYVVAPMNKGEEKVLSFTNDDEGSIKLAINLKALKTIL